MDASNGNDAGLPPPDTRRQAKHLTFAEKIEQFEARADLAATDPHLKDKPHFSLMNNIIIEHTTKKALEAKNIRMNQIHHKRDVKNPVTPNFHFHGEDLAFAKRSLYLFSEASRFRQRCVWLSTHR